MIADYPDLHRFFNISLTSINGPVDPASYHLHAGPTVFGLLRHRKVLDLVECLIGEEISSSPVQQMRMKPPMAAVDRDLKVHSNVGATTWHQDIVALLPEADETEQVTVWLAITEATEQNGCLLSVPGSHREGPQVHCSNEEIASEPHVPERVTAARKGCSLAGQARRCGAVSQNECALCPAEPFPESALEYGSALSPHRSGVGAAGFYGLRGPQPQGARVGTVRPLGLGRRLGGGAAEDCRGPLPGSRFRGCPLERRCGLLEQIPRTNASFASKCMTREKSRFFSILLVISAKTGLFLNW